MDLLRWRFNGSRARWPATRGEPHPSRRRPRGSRAKTLKATWIGHSTVLVQTAGLNILTDPFLSERASPVAFAGPRRVRPPALTPEGLPPIDIILLSHNHYDHMDLPALRAIAAHHAPHVVTPRGNARWIRKASPRFRIDELHWGDALTSDGARDPPDARPALVEAQPVRCQHRAVGRLRGRDAGRHRSISRATRAMARAPPSRTCGALRSAPPVPSSDRRL